MHWRDQMKLNLGRKKILYEKWNMRVKELTAGKEKSRRQQIMNWKIKSIPDEVRNKLMNTYFAAAKKKYLDALIKWMRERDSIEKSKKTAASTIRKLTIRSPDPAQQNVLEVLKEEQKQLLVPGPPVPSSLTNKRKWQMPPPPSKKEVKKLVQQVPKKEEKKKDVMKLMNPPVFVFAPPIGELTNMILNAAENVK